MTEPSTPKLLTWRGQKVYRCRLCAFDTTDKATFEDHFRKRHAPFQVIEGRKQQVIDLHSMTRDQLNTEAGKHGIEDASSLTVYPTKADLIAAIEAAPKE